MGLIAALCGFVSLISTRPKTGRFYIKKYKKRDHHPGSEMVVAYCHGHGRLVLQLGFLLLVGR